MSDAAVGSISHILKTAFKDVYDEEKSRKGERSPDKGASSSYTDSESKQRAEDEAEDDKEIEEPPDADGADEETEGGNDEEKADGMDEDDAPQPVAEPFPEKLSILPHLQEELVSRQAAIDNQISANEAKASELAQYLTEQKARAAEQEVEEEDALKKQGVMVGQHIPPLPSKLEVSAGRLQSYGDYSNNLIIAKEFVEANKVNNLRRTGNLPISELAEQKIEERARKAASKPKDIPNYALPNETTATKTKLMKERYAALEQVRKMEQSEKYASTGGIKPRYEPKYGRLKDQLTGHEKAENAGILQGMQHKMNYLRNPKNVPQTVGRMLTRNDEAYDVHEDFRQTKNGRGGTRIANNNNAGHGGMGASGVVPPGTLASSVELSGVGASTSLHEQSSSLSVPEKGLRKSQDRGHSKAGSKTKGGRGTINGGNNVLSPLFVADPPELLISRYEVGQPVTLPIIFRNVSSISRSVRVLPPSGELFTMAPLKYPPNSQGGMCAPGMGVSTFITFMPESLGDASDYIAVETEGGNFTVPIVAHRDGPKLSLPPMLHLGGCMVGDAMRVQIECANSGGQGKFRVVSEEAFAGGLQQYADCNAQEYQEMGCLRVKPFTVYPVEFELSKGQSINLIMEFVPLELRQFSQRFYILCDSTKIFEYTMTAESKQLDLKVVEINEVAFDAENSKIRREAFFEAANIGIEQSQEVVVANDSGLPVEFEWVWLDRHAHEAEFTHKGVALIEARENRENIPSGVGMDMGEGGEQLHDMADFKASMHGGGNNGTLSQSSFAPLATMDNNNNNNYYQQQQEGGGVGDLMEGSMAGGDYMPVPAHMEGVSKPATTHTAAPTTPGFGVMTPLPMDTHVAGMGGEVTLRPLSGTPDMDSENQVRDGPFKLSPARGVIGIDGHETFKITFVPFQTQFTAMKAVLMLRRVPQPAVQDDLQASRLSQLAYNGHGEHCRLLSWLEAMGQRMTVPDPEAAREQIAEQEARRAAAAEEEAEEDDDASSARSVALSDLPAVKEKIVSLRTIRDIAFNHANGSVLPSDMFSLEKVIRMVAIHTHHWLKGQEDDEEDDLEAALLTEPLSPEEEQRRADVLAAFNEESVDDKVSIFYLPPPERMKAKGAVGPELVDASFSLRHNHVNLDAAMDEDLPPIGEGEEDADADPNAVATEAELAAVEPALPPGVLKYSASEQEVPAGQDRLGHVCLPGALLPIHENLLDHIWLLPSAAARMLGPYMCEVLDSQVKHEAVDYLREKALKTVSCLSVLAGGEGKSQKIDLSPVVLAVGGELPLEKTWSGKVTLRNPSSAIAEVEFVQNRMSIVSNTGPGGAVGTTTVSEPESEPAMGAGMEVVGQSQSQVQSQEGTGSNSNTELIRLNKLQVELDPPRMLLMPESEATVNVHVTAFCLGDYTINIPVQGADGSDTAVDSLNIAVKTCGPRMRFIDPEVDLGLAGVGTTVTQTFNITNDGATPAAFSFEVLSEQDMARAAAAAAAINEDGSVKVDEGVDSGNRITRSASGDSEDGFGEESQAISDGNGTVGAPDSSMSLASKMTGFTGVGKQASVSVEPSMGMLNPGEIITVTATCQGGVLPQRVRGSLRCRVGSSMQEVDPMPDQFLSFRCEVQAPKTVMYPMAVDVGKVYLGVPVYFEVTTANICNLPAAYQLERPGGESSAYSLVFDKPNGPLGAKEKITVKCQFTAHEPGVIDDIIANKIRGVAVPLGFVLTGEAKAPAVDTLSLGAGPVFDAAPAPLAHPSMARFPNGGDPPAPNTPVSLNFGADVTLYERKLTKFAVRNLSPVPMSFSMEMSKFRVSGSASVADLSDNQVGGGSGTSSRAGGKSRGSATSSARSSRVGTRAGTTTTSMGKGGNILVPHEDGANKFHSVDGRKHAEASVQRKENRLFLTSGLGASYLLDCQGATDDIPLEPWGVVTVVVRTFNDMPGIYDDKIALRFSDALGLGWNKTVTIPVQMTVTGCPLIIEKSTYGMTEQKNAVSFQGKEGEKDGNKAAAAAPEREQMLSFGCSPVNADPVERDLIVVNNGSMPGKVTWKIRAETGELNGPVKVSINVQEEEIEDEATGEMKEELKVRTVLGFWADEAKDVPFQITPTNAVVEPYGRQKFKLTFFRTDSVAKESARLVGSVRFADPVKPRAAAAKSSGGGVKTLGATTASPGGNMLEASTSAVSLSGAKGVPPGSEVAEESTLIPAPSKANQSYRLNLLLGASVVDPAISIDKRVFVASAPETEVPLLQGGIKFKASAPQIFGRGDAHKNCEKIINVVNPTETTLTCTVSAEGHFTLTSATDDSRGGGAKNAVEKVRASTSMMSQTLGAPSVRTAYGADSLGKTITLTPHASYSFKLDFAPSRNMRATIAQPRDVTVGGSANTEDGQLVVSFNTGQRLSLPLLGSIATPFIVGSAPDVNFGVCRVGANCDGTLLLTNPTPVGAKWTVKHVPPIKSDASRRKKANDAMAIRVPGYSYPDPETDDPSVFIITPSAGMLAGPTVTVTAATAAMPKDVNRTGDSGSTTALMGGGQMDRDNSRLIEVVPQRLAESSWASSTLTLRDNLTKKHDSKQDFEADANFPSPVTIQFRPIANRRYGSRFRFTCEFGNSFDVMLYGNGTYEEHEHAPRYPKPGFKGAESHLPY